MEGSALISLEALSASARLGQVGSDVKTMLTTASPILARTKGNASTGSIGTPVNALMVMPARIAVSFFFHCHSILCDIKNLLCV